MFELPPYTYKKPAREGTPECGGFYIIKTGEVIWSAHRHDFYVNDTEEFFVDGGYDYMRTNVMGADHAIYVRIDPVKMLVVPATDGDELTLEEHGVWMSLRSVAS